MPSPADHQGRVWDTEISCPWCGHRFQDSWDVSLNTTDLVECRQCEQPIEVVREVVAEYGCRKPLLDHPRPFEAVPVEERRRA